MEPFQKIAGVLLGATCLVSLTACNSGSGTAVAAESPPGPVADPSPDPGTDPSPPLPPNFIFILADDLGWGDLGTYGNQDILTPNLDELARQGSIFTQFYAASPVCSPSRAAFMTGRFPAEVRIHNFFGYPDHNMDWGMDNYLDPDIPTVTSLLHSAGYVTGHFGKWHLSSDETRMALPIPPDPGAYGIDEHVTEVSTGPHFPRGLLPDPFFRARSSQYIVDETIRFIEDHRNEPFYVNVWFLLPHAVLNPTDEQTAPYDHLAPSEELDVRGAKQIYFASVTDIDTQVGRLLRRLDDLGLAQNTVVVFSSDQGPETVQVDAASHSAAGSSGPFRGKKRSLYEGGVRVPLIVRWPDHVPANNVDTSSVVAAVDLLPTVAELAGVDLPPGLELDGESVADLMTGAQRPRLTKLLWEIRFRTIGRPIDRSPRLAIRDGNYKLLMNPDATRIELYDMAADSREMNNLALHSDPGIEPVIQDLSGALLNWYSDLPEGKVDAAAGSDRYPLESRLGLR